MKQVITRFAPSPTGNLHIGSARTALFNYLFARHHNGKFLLRIEDTDQKRSTAQSLNSILSGLKWLDINHDDDIIYQLSRIERHKEVATQLLKSEKAYLCFTSQEEINAAREEAILKGESFKFVSKWRDADKSTHPTNIKPTIRIKAPLSGEMIIHDLVQGKVRVGYDHLDDMILLRSDGTPTYMFAVVVDDHDMNISHIIRGDDHLNNAFRQQVIFEACGWDVPLFAHIPLIHSQDGAKLSKRHGATSVDEYKEIGYLPTALCNYLLRLGWSHGNDEIIPRTQAIDWFNIESIGKSAARFDAAKLDFLNSHYIKETDNKILAEMIYEHLPQDLDEESKDFILAGIEGIKIRAKLLTDLVEFSKIYITSDIFEYSEEARKEIESADKNLLQNITIALNNLEIYSHDNVKILLSEIAEEFGIKISELMKPLRAILTGRTNSPSVFDIIAIMGKEHIIRRISLYS